MVKGWLISLLLIACWIPIQICVFHVTSTRQRFRTLTLLFILTLPVYLVCYLLTSPNLGFLPQRLVQTPFPLGLINGLGLHGLLYLTYVACYYYIDRPVTSRILIELLKAPNNELTLSEMKTVYGLKEMIEWRLGGLKDAGLVVEREGRYFLSSRGEILGRIFYFGRKVLRIEVDENITSLSLTRRSPLE